MARCPGQDMRYWTADDIFDVRCPYCDNEIEFWKDEPIRMCRECGMEVRNPRINLGCAKWCKSAAECLGRQAEDHGVAAPVIESLRAGLDALSRGAHRACVEHAEDVHALADTLLAAEGGDPCLVKVAALLAGAREYRDNAGATFLRPDQLDTLFERAHLETARRHGVEAILAALDADTPPTEASGRVVWDALAIARCQWRLRQEGSCSRETCELAGRLSTHAGRLLAKHRFGPEHAG